MYSKTLFIVGAGVLLGFIFLVVILSKNQADLRSAQLIEDTVAEEKFDQPLQNTLQPSATGADPLNTTYMINEVSISFIDGDAVQMNNHAQLIAGQISVISAPVAGDLDNDRDRDAALILAEEINVDQVTYYVVAAINQDGNFQGTNAIALENNVIPQNIQIEPNGLIVIKYVQAEVGSERSVKLNQQLSQYFRVQNRVLEKVTGTNL